ncbi:hypothetical protein [Planctomyces sp. SH-PL14]|uniref:hypothetical protein n=1 Tax=Planctomyces sp. SH-PL14 TaxID=1632864 RepID=UPI0009467D67|nr:hypothetical protein [Planctomyces sp. SH-PL14]
MPLVVRITDPHFKPTSCRALPGAHSFGMPKGDAALLAAIQNVRAMRHAATLHPNQQEIRWAVVAIHADGFVVVKVNVQGWKPKDAFDLPPDAWPLPVPNVVGRCAAQEFNRKQMGHSANPAMWCLPVKQIRLDDLTTAEEVLALAMKGGVA